MQPTQLEPEVNQPRAKPKPGKRAIWAGLAVLFGLPAFGYGVARLVDWIGASCTF